MEKKKTLILAALALAVLLVGAGALYKTLSQTVTPDTLGTQGETQPDTSASQEEPPTMPDFTVLDGNGEPVSLSQLRGKPVVLNLWASWCGPCKSEMPAFEDAFGEYGDQIHFMMINLTDGSQETMEKAQSYISQQGFTFPVYYDTQLEAAIAYGATTIPATYFIDAEGFGVAYARTALSREMLQQGIDMLLPQ